MIKGVLRSCLVLMPYQWHKTWSRCTTRCKKMSSALPPHSALRPSCIYPGHGPPIAAAAATLDEYLAHRLAREEGVASVVQSGASRGSPFAIVDVLYSDRVLVPELRQAAAETVWNHLRRLRAHGRVRCVDEARPWGQQTWVGA